ncbi:hypothetical protein D187_000440 [Cystobacter fuscus DSM 2262]|uniref:Uncharacterized protein n=1 Tax=Cystobacter fuscus (strain ATCC 25194 / DSM 2262 / NBRC 100088 / M29) TaxID=1242864 RepID=S9PL89_CYSF2|nr:hypothetical protein D187_000440 [Cystobacter fuscus DSM 2262]
MVVEGETMQTSSRKQKILDLGARTQGVNEQGVTRVRAS